VEETGGEDPAEDTGAIGRRMASLLTRAKLASLPSLIMISTISAAAPATASAILSFVAGGDGSRDGDGDGGERPGVGHKYQDQTKGQRDLYTQIVISSTLGLSAFFAFCVGFPCVYALALAFLWKYPIPSDFAALP
jgi:hypothetical protein